MSAVKPPSTSQLMPAPVLLMVQPHFGPTSANARDGVKSSPPQPATNAVARAEIAPMTGTYQMPIAVRRAVPQPGRQRQAVARGRPAGAWLAAPAARRHAGDVHHAGDRGWRRPGDPGGARDAHPEVAQRSTATTAAARGTHVRRDREAAASSHARDRGASWCPWTSLRSPRKSSDELAQRFAQPVQLVKVIEKMSWRRPAVEPAAFAGAPGGCLRRDSLYTGHARCMCGGALFAFPARCPYDSRD